ncbi:MAG: penicillin-binding protein activator [Nitrosomonas sp.]|nr:penicillin-binding protein activator [Nitrosomonas sp.]MDP1949625.1 penicillin-binding protein activator [Nitrosomonas sp.]
MQQFIKIFLVLIVTLYGSPQAFSTDAEDYSMEDAVADVPLVPHIALLLPLQSSSFGDAAEVVQQGFVTATMRGEALPLIIRVYATSADPLDILVSYQEAIAAGAVMVVGPLTRDGVSALASSHLITVPTLTLNAADSEHQVMPPNLYQFGLQMENEASQVAAWAGRENKQHAIIISDNNPLSRRLQTAFANQWLQLIPHATVDSIAFDADQGTLNTLRRHTAGKDALIFLALDAEKSRLLRHYLNPSTPVYATSQIFINSSDSLFNHDLDNIKFLDMPWLLQPDHPAVMAYQRADKPLSTDMERLYALGIDAFRLMALMFQARSAHEVSLDGVTGYIRFVPPNQFVREPIAARFDKGRVLLVNIQEEVLINER